MADNMQGYSDLNLILINIVYISIGKKRSLMCSQVDSLTGEKRALIFYSYNHL